MRTPPKLPVSIRARMPVVCPPERQGSGLALRIAGYACRTAVLWLAVFGLAWFVCDAFLLTAAHDGPLAVGWLALISLGATLLFAAMSLSRIGFLLGAAGIAGGIAYAVTACSAAFWRNHAATALNACLERLIRMGYGGPAAGLIPVAEGAADTGLALRLAAALLILLLAAIFVPSLIKRTHIYLPAATAALIMIPVFTYNISRSNWGLAVTVSAFAGILVLAAYDRRYLKRQADCDNEARIFPPPESRPAVLPRPAHLDERARRRAEEKQERTVDEEIEHYLGKAAPVKKKLTPAERAEQKRAERTYYASRRALRRWQRGQRSARVAAGGFAGLGMLAISMLILLIPAAYAEESFTTVSFIDEPMQIVRRYVTAYLMGDNPILDEMGYGGNASNFAPHSTDAAPRHFTGEEILAVETMYNTNLYLRGWIATDYRDGSWYSADSRGEDVTFENYRSIFGTAFSPELLRTNFYSIVDPSVTTDTDYTKRYQNHTERGFVTMQVNLRRLGGNSNMVYLPSYYNPRVGVLKYISDEPTDYTYVNYFDGIYTGRRFLPGAEYAAVAYATTMRDDTFMGKVSVDIAAYNLANRLYDALRANTALPDFDTRSTYVPDDLPLRVDIANRETGFSVTLFSADALYVDDVYGARTLALAAEILTRYLNYNQAELNDLEYTRRVENYYRDFVYSTYRSKADSPIIAEIAASLGGTDSDRAQILDSVTAAESNVDPSAYYTRHAVVMQVMNMLGEQKDLGEVDAEGNSVLTPTYTYTLSPTVQPDPDLDGVENFLTVTKEGYCVQFASAAALILRELGIPARYVEGYIVTDFRRNLAATSTQRYSATVRDYHAHAWIEVWYDGLGWINYEATPPYMADMYEQPESSYSPSTARPWDSLREEEEEDPIDPDELARLEAELAAEEARQRRIMITCIVLAVTLVIAVIVTTVAVIVSRARQADRRRDALYTAARSEAPARETARALIDEAAALLAACGAAPRLGEQRDEYVARIEADYAALSSIPLGELFAAIAAEEFGAGMPPEAVAHLAAFRAALGESAKARLPLGQCIALRYLRHLL